jgi:uncharacterized phage protein gp47/JayE
MNELTAIRDGIYRIRNHEDTGMVGAEYLAQQMEDELSELENVPKQVVKLVIDIVLSQNTETPMNTADILNALEKIIEVPVPLLKDNDNG